MQSNRKCNKRVFINYLMEEKANLQYFPSSTALRKSTNYMQVKYTYTLLFSLILEEKNSF